ncbi:histidine kinase [Alteribacter lacisalsi]|uniref:histidine kinase n=1 Tax=Alteribacter lacisalsi TaxID=2045244 RepID=A0A2W0HG68_9BACI|nr:GAF domain-containing sensor histidine kinase [Alteribacter lacisalsi]PYZ98920.1 histidine kinase [Alteribacter lacisalsi]
MNRRDELFLIKSIAERLNKETSADSMFKVVLQQILKLTNLQSGWIFLINSDRSYTLAASASLPEALACENRKYMNEGGCYCINRCADGRLNEAANIIECKRIEDALRFERGDIEGITHHASIPLKTGNETFGLLNIASPDKKKFSTVELTILESVALQIGTAWERIRLSEREKANRILEERNRLARDLHDSVNQQLFSIMYTAKGLERHVADPETLSGLREVHAMSKQALAQMKSLIWQLRPDRIEEGLESNICGYGKEQGLHVMYRSSAGDIPDPVRTGFWKITREALNNVKKHAGTSDVHVTLSEKDGCYQLNVQDYGKGFQTENPRSGCLGLLSMQERAALMNGRFSISSSPEKGTKITVTVKKEGENRE